MLIVMILSIIAISIISIAAEKLHVHLVPHSHDDPGWLKTVDQYFTGSNSSVYLASVQYIFDSVVTELRKDTNRHFTFCEISFFSRWYKEQSKETREAVKKLVSTEQIQFVNGGWVMHDEASSHYVSMIDQTSLGHKFLKEEFGYTPTVGWQIDPFGHSNTHAWLSSAVGFDSLFFGRIDYQDHGKRMTEKRMEMIWKGSKSDKDREVFTGVFTSGNYGAPAGFCFDTSCHYCRDDPVVEDSYLETCNADDKVQAFIAAILDEQSHSVGNNIMIKMGADFTWDNANTWYKSIDVLIRKINAADDRFNLFYSDPVKYTRARAAEALTWTDKTDDFFPYSDSEHCFWAGYFTSRPTLKYFERYSSSVLQMLKQFSSAIVNPSLPSTASTRAVKSYRAAISQLTAAIGLVNHHDAITGTSKQHVAEDYKKILAAALSRAEDTLSATVAAAISSNPLTEARVSMCCLMNETVCEATQSLGDSDAVTILVYNPLPRTRSQQITVMLSDLYKNKDKAPSALMMNISVYAIRYDSKSLEGVELTAIPSEVYRNVPLSSNQLSADLTAVFSAQDVPAMSTALYVLSVNKALVDNSAIPSSNPSEPETVQLQKSDAKASSSSEDSFSISNDLVSISFSKSTGLMQAITRRDSETDFSSSKITTTLTQDLKYYQSFGSPGAKGYTETPKDDRDSHLKNIKRNPNASPEDQASGAYIFRPSSAIERPISMSTGNEVKVSVMRGQLVSEVRQNFSSWASQIVRVRQGQAAVEIEWTVGPIPVSDGIGKEVISDIQTDLQTGGRVHKFFTDSNGREFMERIFNYRPTWDLEVFEPIAGNYYPITAAAYMVDENAGLQLSVLSDRSEGAASVMNGQLELMVHRRLLADDDKGVDEPLNETAGGMSHYPSWERFGDGIVVRGKHLVLLSNIQDAMRELRTMMDEQYLPFFSFYSPAQALVPSDIVKMPSKTMLRASPLGVELPINIHLVTLEAIAESKLLVRLGHQFAVGEAGALSAEVTMDLRKVLSPFSPQSCAEYTLSANELYEERQQRKVQWDTGAGLDSKRVQKATGGNDPCVVTIAAMQIKTYIIQY